MTRLAPVLSPVWRDQAATSPVCQIRWPIPLPSALREVVPGLRRLAILGNVGNPGAVLDTSEAQAAASAVGLEATTFEIRRAEEIAPLFEALKGADALYVASDPLVNTNRIRLNTLALGTRLPTMHGVRDYVEAA